MSLHLSKLRKDAIEDVNPRKPESLKIENVYRKRQEEQEDVEVGLPGSRQQ